MFSFSLPSRHLLEGVQVLNLSYLLAFHITNAAFIIGEALEDLNSVPCGRDLLISGPEGPVSYISRSKRSLSRNTQISTDLGNVRLFIHVGAS
jgi:hypothetical protein